MKEANVRNVLTTAKVVNNVLMIVLNALLTTVKVETCLLYTSSRQIAKELNISGPFNIQFLARNNEVKVIECNLRASRSFPFVSKVLKRNFIETATRIMLDAPYSQPDKTAFDIDWIGVKASQFSFSRLHKADPVLGVDMSSTGEVGCIGDDFSEALLNAMIATGFKIPEKAVMFSSGAMKSKVDLLDASRMLFAKGYQIYATAGTAAFLNAQMCIRDSRTRHARFCR